MICENFVPNTCTLPPTPSLNLTGWFAKPKPNPLPPPKSPSGTRLKVLHLSDFHIDPRPSFVLSHRFLFLTNGCAMCTVGYATSSEANCTSGLCCRANNFNKGSPNNPVFPAPRYGSFLWCVPWASVRDGVGRLLTDRRAPWREQRHAILTRRCHH
jgi:sphingomyelin phosphodiesterase